MRSLFTLFCACCSISALATEYQYGPLLTYAQAPLASHSLTPQLRDGFSLPISSQELFSGFSSASIWSDSQGYKGDFYQNQFSLGLKWQLSELWQTELSYRYSQAGNNRLDSLTMGFHDLLGLDQNGRDSVDRHRFHISIPEQNITWDSFNGATLSQAVSLYSQYQLYNAERHGLSLGVSLYYNQTGLLRLNRFEQAVQVNYTYQQNSHRIYSLLGVVHHNHSTGILPTKPLTLTAAVGYEYQINAKHQLFGSFHLYQGTVDNPKELNKPATEYLLGYRYVMTSSAIEIAMTENIFSTDNSADIALHLNYRYRS